MQRLSRLARSKGIVTIVDGAHALGHFPFKLRDLECDAYGVSLHKWLLAPLGNGCLYVRKEMIPRFWPLQAAPEQQDNDIRKFESIGTHPWAIRAALGESLAFHQAIGAERKAARLRYLNMRWVNALKATRAIKVLTDIERAAPGLGRHGRQHRRHRCPPAGHIPDGTTTGSSCVPLGRRGAAELGLRLPGPSHLAERLHDARGDRHVRRGHDRGAPRAASPNRRTRSRRYPADVTV
ncbi:MAG: aminotransferase class V-fold PLP-dependent enzyme [Desulfobacterales bacterium]|nr:aminotransferase class V-fold PLP-dependent enzyme [Desulfobacterales bacterium]